MSEEKDNKYIYLKNIIDSVADPIFVKDRKHRWIDGNEAFWNLMGGRSPSEVIGKSDYDFFPKDEADVFWAKDEEVFTSGKENINIESFTDSSGVKHTLSTKKSCFTNEKGELILVGIIRDITELTKMENKLKQSDEERLRSIMNYSGRIVYIKDLQGRYLQTNKVMLDAFGMKEKDLLGKTDLQVFPKGKYSKLYMANDKQVIAAKRAIEFEEYADLPDGTTHIYVSMKFPLFDSNGEIYAVCGISADVTNRKRAEEDMHMMMDELKRTNTELEKFAYICSHDLQEPLRTINSFTQLLEKHLADKLDEKAKHYVQFITEGSTRARDLISDVLKYSRVNIDMEKPKKVDLEAVLDIIRNNLDVRLKEVNATISNDSLPIIFANKSQLIQLLQNLIQNAVKFCTNDEPHVHVSVKRIDGFWQFSVKDNGIGIAPQYKEKIFEIFQRLHKRNEYPGTGIGLAICKKIIERHGGNIWVESEIGEGATFHFTLPVDENDEYYPETSKIKLVSG